MSLEGHSLIRKIIHIKWYMGCKIYVSNNTWQGLLLIRPSWSPTVVLLPSVVQGNRTRVSCLQNKGNLYFYVKEWRGTSWSYRAQALPRQAAGGAAPPGSLQQLGWGREWGEGSFCEVGVALKLMLQISYCWAQRLCTHHTCCHHPKLSVSCAALLPLPDELKCLAKLFHTRNSGLKFTRKGLCTQYSMSEWNKTKHKGKDKEG